MHTIFTEVAKSPGFQRLNAPVKQSIVDMVKDEYEKCPMAPLKFMTEMAITASNDLDRIIATFQK